MHTKYIIASPKGSQQSGKRQKQTKTAATRKGELLNERVVKKARPSLLDSLCLSVSLFINANNSAQTQQNLTILVLKKRKFYSFVLT